jgi:hypothetical protein
MNRNVITTRRVGRLVDWMVGESLHAKRVESLTNAVVGVVNAVSLATAALAVDLSVGRIDFSRLPDGQQDSGETRIPLTADELHW